MANKKVALSVIATGAVLGAAYFTYQYLVYVSTDNAQIEAHAVMLAAKVGGYVKEVKVNEGDKVKPGDVMVSIDSRDYENNLTQAKGDLTSLQARKKDAERNFRRLQDLYAKGAVSQQQYDTSSAGYSEVKAKYDSASALVAQAELNLQNVKILAPSNGYIAKKSVEIGQLATPGVPLLGFVSSEERWVTANFKETEISDLRIGAKVIIDVDAIPGRSFSGKIESISAATGSTFTLLPPDNATGNFTKVVQRVPVKIVFSDLKDSDIDQLRAGLSVVVKVFKH